MTTTNTSEALPLLASGKVRDLYEVDAKTLLFVASDRISAYDVIMKNGIPNKGTLLTLMTAHWFSYLQTQIPDLKTHFISLDLSTAPQQIPHTQKQAFKDRSMLVRRLKVFPVEAIVRGYITGSAWSSYKSTSTVNGVKLPPGLQESQAFPTPIYTPSTKAELGQHDENISIETAASIVGPKYAQRIQDLSLAIYTAARDHALTKGIILADTKFEFGLDEETDEVVLIDEVLTPDSSRYWDARTYGVGRGQDSFDKQFLRDWLTAHNLKGVEGVEMPEDVVVKTAAKYSEAYRLITGETLEETLSRSSS